MNCATHPQTPATAFCRSCGKALCDECKRDVRGVIYCEDCIVARLSDTMPAVGAQPAAAPGGVVSNAPNPALAAILGCIPFGIGAVYNGQYAKALAHLVTFAVLVVAVDNVGSAAEPFFAIALTFFIFYQIFDAYRTAKAKQLGEPVPDPAGIYHALGIPLDGGNKPAVAEDGTATVTPAPRIPMAAIVLIVIGALFLLQNLGWFHFHWIGRLWPLILIFFGVRILMRNQAAR
jgi:hypothetical protein